MFSFFILFLLKAKSSLSWKGKKQSILKKNKKRLFLLFLTALSRFMYFNALFLTKKETSIIKKHDGKLRMLIKKYNSKEPINQPFERNPCTTTSNIQQRVTAKSYLWHQWVQA
jgi:hypothetical protein